MSLSTRSSLLRRMGASPADRDWVDFCDQYGPLIERWCRREGVQQADAQDVRQLVLVALGNCFPRFSYDRSRGRFRDYLGVAVRNAIRKLRTPDRALHTDPDSLVQFQGPDVSLDERWEQDWIQHHLRSALAKVRRQVDARSVEVFERLLETGDVQAVAADLGIQTAAVQKIKERMRTRLRQVVAEQVAREDGLLG